LLPLEDSTKFSSYAIGGSSPNCIPTHSWSLRQAWQSSRIPYPKDGLHLRLTVPKRAPRGEHEGSLAFSYAPPPELWDGSTALRIAELLRKYSIEIDPIGRPRPRSKPACLMTILPNSGSTQVTPAELTSEASVCTHSDPLLSPQAPATLPTFLAHLLNSDHRTIVTNIWSLSLITIATYIFPLIVLPYVTRVLGPRAFGAIALLLAAAQNCCLVVNYGFGFTASRNVAIQKDNPAALSRILSCTIATKLLLLVLCVVLSACVFEAIPSFRNTCAVSLVLS